jgi:serine/threonine-protein kinase
MLDDVIAGKLSPGTLVAGFRVESLVGRGAMAEVYRARGDDGQIVALKLLDDGLARDERFRQRFLRESQLAKSLDHPNIVRTVTSGEDEGRLFLAMAFVDGSDLRGLLREDGRFEPERAVGLTEQVAGGLDAAHAAGLVHRDVKPGNILVETHEDGEHAYICDFGLARHVSSVSSLTGDRAFVGTIDYVPPEQIEGRAIDGRADVYSLGCVLYECIAGTRPFDRDSELSVVFAHLNDPPPKVTEDRPELPAAFDDVFATALAKSPDDRYSSCGELAAAARAALHGEVLAPRRRPGRRAVGVAVLIAALVVAAVAGLLLTGNHAEPPATITPTSIAGARLGDPSALLTRMWGGGQTLAMTEPPNYSVLTQRARNVSAYFIGAHDTTVELTTWNAADRTAEGIGPCSTVAELKKAYGTRLKPSPNNTHNGIVYAWTLGKHLVFAMEFVPGGKHPTTVGSVGLYDNPLSWASFNASNDGPCARATDTSVVRRPARIPAVATPALPTTLASQTFRPHLSVRVPSGWALGHDTSRSFSVASPNGSSIEFVLDPLASTAGGAPVHTVSTTPRGLTTWLQKRPGLVVTAPQTILMGTPLLTATSIDVRLSKAAHGGVIYFTSPAGALRSNRARPVRLYLTPIRIATLAHTLAIVDEAPSQQAFEATLPVTTAIVKNLKIQAAAAANLSALSGFCSVPFNGTCLGEVDAGTHSTSSMRPALTYTVPIGWTNSGDMPGFFGLIPPGGDYTGVNAGQSDYINVATSITTGNGRCGDGHGTARTPEEFVRWLRQQPGFAPFVPRPVTIGGLSGVVVDLTMRRNFRQPCRWSRGLPAQQVLTGLPPSPDQLNHSIGAPAPRRMVMRLYLLRYKHGTLGIEIDDVRGDSRIAGYSGVVKTFHFAPR